MYLYSKRRTERSASSLTCLPISKPHTNAFNIQRHGMHIIYAHGQQYFVQGSSENHHILDFLFRSSKSFPEFEINKTIYFYMVFIINHDLHIGQMIIIYS